MKKRRNDELHDSFITLLWEPLPFASPELTKLRWPRIMKTLKGKAGKINNLIVQRLWPLPFSGQMPLRVPFCASLALLKTAKVKGLEEGHGSLAEHEGSWTQEEPWHASPFHSLLLCSKNVPNGPVPILRGQVGVGTSCFLRFFLFLSCFFFLIWMTPFSEARLSCEKYYCPLPSSMTEAVFLLTL